MSLREAGVGMDKGVGSGQGGLDEILEEGATGALAEL